MMARMTIDFNDRCYRFMRDEFGGKEDAQRSVGEVRSVLLSLGEVQGEL